MTTPIPHGYKLSPVGVIPEDWEVIRLGSVLRFKNGLNKEKKYFGKGIPIVNYMDVFRNKGIQAVHLTGKVDLTPQEIKNYDVKKGDVFFTRTSETVEEIGISAVVVEEVENTVFSGFVLRGRPIDSTFEVSFCQYCFSSNVVRYQIISKASYTTRALTNGRLLSDVLIALPPTKAEQTRIATALGDTDALITALEKLTAKKRMIKHGAMQELLRPKDGWEVKRLGDVLKVRHGKSQKGVAEEHGIYPILATGGIIGKTNKYLHDKPSVLIGRKGTIDTPQFMDSPFWSVDTLFYTEVFGNYDAKFIFYMFTLVDWYAYNEASGVPSLNARTIENIEKYFPKTKAEQTRIATILSDMDAEIEALERRVAKVRLLKQGMMQSLLAGKVRLV